MKINTFKPYFCIIKRYKLVKINDYFSLNFNWGNQIQISITIYGYGFRIGITLFDILSRHA